MPDRKKAVNFLSIYDQEQVAPLLSLGYSPDKEGFKSRIIKWTLVGALLLLISIMLYNGGYNVGFIDGSAHQIDIDNNLSNIRVKSVTDYLIKYYNDHPVTVYQQVPLPPCFIAPGLPCTKFPGF